MTTQKVKSFMDSPLVAWVSVLCVGEVPLDVLVSLARNTPTFSPLGPVLSLCRPFQHAYWSTTHICASFQTMVHNS